MCTFYSAFVALVTGVSGPLVLMTPDNKFYTSRVEGMKLSAVTEQRAENILTSYHHYYYHYYYKLLTRSSIHHPPPPAPPPPHAVMSRCTLFFLSSHHLPTYCSC
eukprot:scaffold3709_cov193-Ochromonas_danica.AAC.1